MTAFIYDDIFLRHDTGPHPEKIERLRAITAHLRETGMWDSLQHVTPRAATEDDITAVHEPAVVERVKAACGNAPALLDMGDTVVSSDSYDAAVHAAGACLDAVDGVVEGKFQNAFCAVRPPGHHATPTQSMGFCLFNNIAVAARYAQRQCGIERTLIVDWDVHHGNGTQDVFYTDPSVLYFSAHKAPFYPGTGWEEEIGAGEGKGAIVNVPLNYLTTREAYLEKFQQVVEGQCRDFAPELVLISAGFDAYAGDPIGGLRLQPEDFRTLTDALTALAKETAGGRVVSSLEGGYDLAGLAACVEQHIRGLMAAEE